MVPNRDAQLLATANLVKDIYSETGNIKGMHLTDFLKP